MRSAKPRFDDEGEADEAAGGQGPHGPAAAGEEFEEVGAGGGIVGWVFRRALRRRVRWGRWRRGAWRGSLEAAGGLMGVWARARVVRKATVIAARKSRGFMLRR